MTGALRVLVADDSAIVRRGVKHILLELSEVAEVGEATHAHDALALARQSRWDVVVLDIGLPGRGGLDLVKILKAEFPKIHILVLSRHREDDYALRALRAGACGYLTKDAAPEQLAEAVKRIAAGNRYITPALAERLAAALQHDSTAPAHASLSDREFDVFKRLGNGMTVGQIARELVLSVKTVSGYRANILQKTGLSNNAAIMKYVLDHRLLD